jgi:hypothetical protein
MVVDGTLENNVINWFCNNTGLGSGTVERKRSDKNGRYFESIWSGFPGDVWTALIV